MVRREEESLKEILEGEIRSRCEQMTDPSYRSVKALNKADWIGIIVMAVVMVALIIIGLL